MHAAPTEPPTPPVPPAGPPDLACAGLHKAFGRRAALRGVDLAVERGGFFAVVGPSGCGKSTLLRVVGGHERADAGAVRIRGEDVTDAPPERRPVHTVFQHHALFPHLRVVDNVAFPLRMAGVPRAERRRMAEEALALVRLPGTGARDPATLSGGERQRVALARAIVRRPAVLLLDEPLGALDLPLRRAMQDELRDLRRETGLTFLHVTHDQEEAFRLADRVAVMRDGLVVQEGEPREVYRRPRTAFAAAFLGVANRLPGAVAADGAMRTEGGLVVARAGGVPGPCVVAVREEHVRVRAAAAGEAGGPARLVGRVVDVAFLGGATRATVAVGAAGERLVGHVAPGAAVAVGDGASVEVDEAEVFPLPPEDAP